MCLQYVANIATLRFVEHDKKPLKRDRRERFVTLAEARTGKALQAIRLIGNLSNRSNYEYTERDVQRIVRALNSEIDEMRRRFRTDEQGNRPVFKID